jgi:putative ABC transport system permease protein
VAVVSLAIGVGANCAIFSFADALLLRPLPVARPGEIMTVGSMNSLESLRATALVSSYRDYVDVRDRASSYEGLAAFSYNTAGFASDSRMTPKLKMGMVVTANMFSLMGVEPWATRCGSRNSLRIRRSLGAAFTSTAMRLRSSAWPRPNSPG